MPPILPNLHQLDPMPNLRHQPIPRPSWPILLMLRRGPPPPNPHIVPYLSLRILPTHTVPSRLVTLNLSSATTKTPQTVPPAIQLAPLVPALAVYPRTA